MAKMLNESAKIVFSKTLTNVTWQHSRLLQVFNPREVEALKQQAGQDIMVFGSGTIISLLARHGLIDEHQFLVSPVLLGRGRSLIDGVSDPSRLNLVDVMKYPSGNVMLRYAR